MTKRSPESVHESIKREKVRKLRKLGKTHKRIAEELGLKTYQVQYILSKTGKSTGKRSKKKKASYSKEDVKKVALLYEEGAKQKEISQKTGIPAGTIYALLKRAKDMDLGKEKRTVVDSSEFVTVTVNPVDLFKKLDYGQKKKVVEYMLELMSNEVSEDDEGDKIKRSELDEHKLFV